jgi:hypothetical protein
VAGGDVVEDGERLGAGHVDGVVGRSTPARRGRPSWPAPRGGEQPAALGLDGGRGGEGPVSSSVAQAMISTAPPSDWPGSTGSGDGRRARGLRCRRAISTAARAVMPRPAGEQHHWRTRRVTRLRGAVRGSRRGTSTRHPVLRTLPAWATRPARRGRRAAGDERGEPGRLGARVDVEHPDRRPAISGQGLAMPSPSPARQPCHRASRRGARCWRAGLPPRKGGLPKAPATRLRRGGARRATPARRCRREVRGGVTGSGDVDDLDPGAGVV